MSCFIALLGVIAPRVLIVIWWLVDPSRWTATFNTQLVPALGFVFLPWTTIFFVLFSSSGSLTGLGWVFVVLGLIGDVGTYGGGILGNKDKISYYK